MAPTIGKGKTFPFQVSVVCWVDLLGYGRMISDAGFNPLHPSSSAAKKRLRAYHDVVASVSGRYFPTLVMNDGAVAYKDLSFRNPSVTYAFLQNCWRLFNSIKKVEEVSGYPGARMVIAAGFRMRGRRSGLDATASQFESILKRLEAREIDTIQALHEARQIRPTFDIIPQLQANFAFTKAYVAEQSGTKGGLAGSRCFVDCALFQEDRMSPLDFDEKINWNHEGYRLQARFSPLKRLPTSRPNETCPSCIRDGLQVAQHLAGNNNVIDALRNAQKD